MNFLIVDCETTNKNPMHCEIIELAYIYADSKLNIIKQDCIRFDVKSWDKEAEEASKIHGIKKEEIKDLHYFDDCSIFLNLLYSIDPSHFVAHANRKIFGKFTTYDYTALKTNLYPLHFAMYEKIATKNIISTHSLAKHLNIPGKLDLKSLAQYFNLKEFKHHSAMDDAEACFELLKLMLPKVDITSFLEHENYGILNENETNEHHSTTRVTKKVGNISRRR